MLVIFCSGAVSHLDSFDFKPELIRLDGQPMPGAKENFLTFQGENGNLVRPLYAFKPRGQTGKMVSDLFPHIASHVDDLCFLHGMHTALRAREDPVLHGEVLRDVLELDDRVVGRRRAQLAAPSRRARRSAQWDRFESAGR